MDESLLFLLSRRTKELAPHWKGSLVMVKVSGAENMYLATSSVELAERFRASLVERVTALDSPIGTKASDRNMSSVT